jgi:hypothetical protein
MCIAYHDSAHVSTESGATVETEPADPEENGSDDNMSNVVRTVWKTLDVVVTASFA